MAVPRSQLPALDLVDMTQDPEFGLDPKVGHFLTQITSMMSNTTVLLDTLPFVKSHCVATNVRFRSQLLPRTTPALVPRGSKSEIDHRFRSPVQQDRLANLNRLLLRLRHPLLPFSRDVQRSGIP